MEAQVGAVATGARLRPAAVWAALACALLPACSGVGHRLRFAGEPPASVSEAGFSWPIDGTVSSAFGRRAPGSGSTVHEGVDIAGAGSAAPVYAARGGVVTASGRSRSYGNWVEVRHDGRWVTRYAHLSRRAVSRGWRVRRGAILGQVGSTGRASGAHLHFEVHRDGRPVDPLSVLPGRRSAAPASTGDAREARR